MGEIGGWHFCMVGRREGKCRIMGPSLVKGGSELSHLRTSDRRKIRGPGLVNKEEENKDSDNKIGDWL